MSIEVESGIRFDFTQASAYHRHDRMRQLLRPYQVWTPAIRVAVLDLAEWNLLYPAYPATAV